MPDLHVPCAEYGIWTDHRIPDDRSDWHPAVRAFYEYWLAITPLGRLPGRQHVKPEDIAPLLSRVWLADVYRDPLRLRFRLAGTGAVWSFGREVTGQWLNEVQSVWFRNPTAYDRFRFTVETGRPSWRRGFALWDRDPEHRRVENCHVPLAKDGKNVDMIFSLAVIFDHKGDEIRI